MCIKKAEEIIELNNAKTLLEKYKNKDFAVEIPYIRIVSRGYSDPFITAENIEHNSKFIVNLFNDVKVADKPKIKTK